MSKPKIYVYDIETYPNLFCVVFNNGGKDQVFEISARINDYDDLCEFYDPDNIKYCIGFNNVNFDAQVMQYLVSNYDKFKTKQGSELVKIIFEFAQEVIQRSNSKGSFAHYPEWKITVPQIDLFLINHYNNKNKMTSLKWIEFSINHDKVQDLPYKYNHNLKLEAFDEVIEYCKNDVRATRSFAEMNKDLISLRIQQNKDYPDLRLLNKPDSSVGESMFLHFMSESMGVEKKDLKQLRTHRSTLAVKDLILPYINFKTPEFQEVLEFYQKSTYGLIDNKGKKIPLKTMARFQGIDFEFGEGGIHASWEAKIFEADDDHEIIDVDVNYVASRK